MSRGDAWKDLGSIRTLAGPASLSQVDTVSPWGPLRHMHVILIKNGVLYILTACAPREEFSMYYKDFCRSFRSLRVLSDAFDFIRVPQQKTMLKNSADVVMKKWIKLVNQPTPPSNLSKSDRFAAAFNGENFQKETWNPFVEMTQQKFGDLGSQWLELFLKQFKDELFEVQNQNIPE